MELKICQLYADLLNLYGDRGNMICMKKRLEWRGINCTVEKLNVGRTGRLSDYDLIFIGGGMEFETAPYAGDLRSGRAAELRAAAEDGVSILAICSGFQLLGNYCENARGEKTELAAVLDMYSSEGKSRFTGNYKFLCGEESGGFEVVGFENHIGRTYLGNSLSPLGSVLSGSGNNGSDGSEGARYKNVFGSYSYGPLLPKNPGLCDAVLLSALERKYGITELQPLSDEAEMAAHRAMSGRLSK